MDLHKELYNVILFHLGETSPRGKKVIPPQHDLLKRDLGRLLSWAYRCGECRATVDHLEQEKKKYFWHEWECDAAIREASKKINCPESRGTTEPVEKAEEFATKCHEGQMYGDVPYIEHSRAVVAVLERFGHLKEIAPYVSLLKQGCWLHDTVEDTDATELDVLEIFGAETAFLVSTVTNKPNFTRKQKSVEIYPRIKAAGIISTALKLLDRIANVENSIATGNKGIFSMYKKEQPEFIEGIKVPGELTELWVHLD